MLPMTPAAGPLPRRFRALDAWRGLCALLVALFHVPVLHPFKDAAAFANLQFCVDFFFVLSGFVLSHAYRDRLADRMDGADFMLARFWRLWPLHVTLLAAYAGFEAVKLAWTRAHPGFPLDAAPFSSGHSPYEFATNLVFLQSFGLHPGVSWNAPSWSIAVEFWTSAVFALVVLLPRARSWVFAALVVGAAGVLLAASPGTLFVTHDWGFARCLLGFFTGCLVYRARRYLPVPRSGVPELAWTGLAVALVALVPQGPLDLLAPLVFAGLVHAFSFERGALSRVFVGGVPQALGRWSFALYMTHALVFQLVRTAATAIEHRNGLSLTIVHADDKLVVVQGAAAAIALALALTVCLALPIGAFAHRFIERPLSRLGAPRQVRPAVEAAVR